MNDMQKCKEKSALILGITGGYGGAMAQALSEAGWRVSALVRDRARALDALPASLQGAITLHQGDVLDEDALYHAARGVQVIVYGVNVPYGQWDAMMPRITRRVCDVAASLHATIAFPGNVYPFAPHTSIAHDTPMNPPTSKGRLRARLEQMLAESTRRGARVITLRGGDFFGTDAKNSWMHHILDKARRGGKLQLPAHKGVRHAWTYLPDFARAHVMLLDMRHELPSHATFHFRGHVLTEEQLLEALQKALDVPALQISYMPWWFIRLGGIFSADWKGLVEMNYLWSQEVLMTQVHLDEVLLGAVPHTSLEEALRHEVDHARGNQSAPHLLDVRTTSA